MAPDSDDGADREGGETLDAPLFGDSGAWKIRYVKATKSEIYPKAMSADDQARVEQALKQLPGAMHGELSTLDIKGPLEAVQKFKLYRVRVGDWRIFFTSETDGVTVLEVTRKQEDTYTKADWVAVVRRGRGVALVEILEPTKREARTAAPKARSIKVATRPEQPNPLTPFDHGMLSALGLDDERIADIRTFAAGVQVAEELAGAGASVETVELVADAWEDPNRYLQMFADGITPQTADAALSEEELAERLAHPDSAESVATLGSHGLELILAEDIEAWMFYLHHSQARIVRLAPTGPARIRGGPGTGKTVAALHRARFLVESGLADKVLLTTFVSALPPVWDGLLQRFAPNVASSISTSTVDHLAREIVIAADGTPELIDQAGETALLKDALDRFPAARSALGGEMPFREEIERVIDGRGISVIDEYLEVSRRGRGLGLDGTQRKEVWAAYEHYLQLLGKVGKTDFRQMRLRALAIVEAGGGPRYDAIIVDEAQDLSEVAVRLLMGVDSDPEHKMFMLVGDGQQSIYPGGFSLRSLDLEVRGRAFVLTTNWRNTDAILRSADLALGQSSVLDLGDELEIASNGSGVPRRAGSAPRLHVAATQPVDSVLATVVGELLADEEGISLGDIAVLSRKNKGVNHALRALEAAGIPSGPLRGYGGARSEVVRCGTFQYSKGLEFKAVIVFGADSSAWGVNPYWLSDTDDISEWWRNERRIFFVAMTRARDSLDMIGGPALSPPVEAAQGTLDEWSW
jgi:hypothetical protein